MSTLTLAPSSPPTWTAGNSMDDHRLPNQCPDCSTARSSQEASQSRIIELEAQVKLLTNKATAAVDKLADYEDELRKLRSAQTEPPLPLSTSKEAVSANGQVSTNNISNENGNENVTPNRNTNPDSRGPSPALEPMDGSPKPLPSTTEAVPLQPRPSIKGRLPSFLTRSNSRSPATAPNGSTTARETELTAQLTQERTLRQAAESKVSQMSSEMEDLSATLFQQANEMVSTEREARAKLEERAARFEERCGVLEDKVRTLEKRDMEKRKRLERLEEGLARLERIKKVLDIS